MATRFVQTDGLNLRSTPEILSDNIIRSMPLCQKVSILDAPDGERFWEVEATINGETHRGFASHRFLREPLSAKKEALLLEAVKEWIRFKHGDAKEDQDPFFKRVGDYWRALGINRDGRSPFAWSAAFMSFIVRRAGYENFKFDQGHDTYIHDAKKKRNANDASAPFWLFRLSEHKPQLGDLVCAWRENPVTFDNMPTDFLSHTDVVVEIDQHTIKTIGGNVGNSVNEKTFGLKSDGHLKVQGELFAIMRNNN